jgi:glucose-1-phosphate thymidylyltransferase
MKGIILAGGLGSRLHPATRVVSKHLLQVYDKPMIYYPLTTLILAGVKEFLIIVNEKDLEQYQELLRQFSSEEYSFQFEIQENPRGLPDAFVIGEKFIGEDSVAMILGDNFFHGTSLGKALQMLNETSGATVFAYHVSNPEDYGVITFDKEGKPLNIVEKPSTKISNFAIPGLYFFDKNVVAFSKSLLPSSRGELEIVDLMKMYLSNGDLQVKILPRGTVWMDMGSFENLYEVGTYVRTIQKRQGMEIGNPAEAISNV